MLSCCHGALASCKQQWHIVTVETRTREHRTMKTNRIEQALETLVALIARGIEYPDAHVRAAERHCLVGRQYALLTEAYDAHCANQ